MYIVAGTAVLLALLLMADPIAAKFPLANFDAEKVARITANQT